MRETDSMYWNFKRCTVRALPYSYIQKLLCQRQIVSISIGYFCSIFHFFCGTFWSDGSHFRLIQCTPNILQTEICDEQFFMHFKADSFRHLEYGVLLLRLCSFTVFRLKRKTNTCASTLWDCISHIRRMKVKNRS